MKLTRLIAYGIAGIVAGLLIENAGLRVKQKTGKKARAMKKSITQKYMG